MIQASDPSLFQEIQDALSVLQQEGGRPLAPGFSLQDRCRWRERLSATQVRSNAQ